MISDNERREVARRLRNLPGDSTYPDLIGVIADRDGWYPAADAADRLADLIEPPARCPHYMHPCCRTDAAGDYIDRDALLALADEIEYGAGTDDGEYDDMPGFMVAAIARQEIAYARRIREALGVES